VDRDLVRDRGIDGDLPARALDRRAVGRAEVAENDLVVLPEELGVLGGEVVVRDDDGVGLRAAERHLWMQAPVELEAPPGGRTSRDLEDDPGRISIPASHSQAKRFRSFFCPRSTLAAL